jgi:cytochrome P450
VSIARTVNIVGPQFKANPFPFLADLRTSQPVYRTALSDKTPVWLITRYEDVAALLKDERFLKNRRAALTSEQLRKMPLVPPMFRPLERNMLDLDVPDHTRLRALVHKAFTLIRYLRRFFDRRRRDPQNDLASALIQAEEAGDKLTEDELLAMVFLLLIADMKLRLT